MAGIYLHVPICRKACHYCNFHFSTSADYHDRMVGAKVTEMEQRADYLEGAVLQSSYRSGRTPSLLSRHQLEFLFDAVPTCWKLVPPAEITLEANPDDRTPEHLKMLRQTTVNRLSIGIQAFHDKAL